MFFPFFRRKPAQDPHGPYGDLTPPSHAETSMIDESAGDEYLDDALRLEDETPPDHEQT
jgi:hypothetical protein